ncbi:MAG: hypothetical protein EOO86_12755 [Pedobacter sp.]|nr:MAG: hypothetical protein EOO86_12755 [Pedobacter sp.]
MKAFLLLLSVSILMAIGSRTYAQDILVKGVIIEKGTNIRIALGVITNKNSGKAVGSNDLGLFDIKAKLGDTLLIEKRNFVSQQFVVNYNKDILIYLIRASTTLEEVTIKGKTKIEDLQDIRREFKRQGSFYEGKPPLALLNPLSGSPLTFFYELFGKTPAKARRFKRYYDNELKLMQVDQFFNKTLISKYTDLDGQNLDKFMLDYSPTVEMIKGWSNYDAVNYIKLSAKKFTDTLKN